MRSDDPGRKIKKSESAMKRISTKYVLFIFFFFKMRNARFETAFIILSSLFFMSVRVCSVLLKKKNDHLHHKRSLTQQSI